MALLAVAAVLGAARPVQRVTLVDQKDNRDIVLCLDVSGSMIDVDAEVVSTFLRLAEGFRGERISMVIFNSSAVPVFPLTDDYDFVSDQLRRAQRSLTIVDGKDPFFAGTLNGAGSSLIGDGLTFGAVLAWSAYTVAAKPLLARHSPIVVTGWSMALGTLFYLPYAVPDLRAVDWRQVSAGAWLGTTLSALLALNLSYVLWNTAVQRIGSSQTAIYSNLIPVAAVGTAAIWLHEPIDRWKAIGATLIVAGLVVATRFSGGRDAIPAEE